jgi:hypothetical protein
MNVISTSSSPAITSSPAPPVLARTASLSTATPLVKSASSLATATLPSTAPDAPLASSENHGAHPSDNDNQKVVAAVLGSLAGLFVVSIPVIIFACLKISKYCISIRQCFLVVDVGDYFQFIKSTQGKTVACGSISIPV